MSPAAAASNALAATCPPCSSNALSGAATMSNPVTWCCAFRRLEAIGAPILPRPIKPIVAIAVSLSVEIELARAKRGKIGIDRRPVDLGEGRRPPVRLAVAVDDQSPHAFIEIMAGHDVLADAEFELERGVEAVAAPDGHLAQEDLEAGWRGAQHRLAGLVVEPGDDLLDRAGGVKPV